jgi:hypothetical protein
MQEVITKDDAVSTQKLAHSLVLRCEREAFVLTNDAETYLITRAKGGIARVTKSG